MPGRDAEHVRRLDGALMRARGEGKLCCPAAPPRGNGRDTSVRRRRLGTRSMAGSRACACARGRRADRCAGVEESKVPRGLLARILHCQEPAPMAPPALKREGQE